MATTTMTTTLTSNNDYDGYVNGDEDYVYDYGDFYGDEAEEDYEYNDDDYYY